MKQELIEYLLKESKIDYKDDVLLQRRIIKWIEEFFDEYTEKPLDKDRLADSIYELSNSIEKLSTKIFKFRKENK